MLLFSAKFTQDKPHHLAYGWWSVNNYPQFCNYDDDCYMSRLFLCQNEMSKLFPVNIDDYQHMIVSLYDEQNEDKTRVAVSLLDEETEEFYYDSLRVVSNKTIIVHTCSDIVNLIKYYLDGIDATTLYVEVIYE